MRPRIVLALALATALATAGVGKAEASFIDLTNYPTRSQPGNSGQVTLEAWLLDAVMDYNAANNPDLPASGLEVFRNINNNSDSSPSQSFPAFGANVVSLNIPVAGYQYLVLHWGGPDSPCQAGRCVDPNYQAIWIGDPGFATYYTATNFVDGHGLSSYGLYGPTANAVPDGGMTLALLGGALIGVGALRRQFHRQ